MSFTNPIWLWGLTGLIVPIGIHLLSLKEGKTVYIGSLRHLRESNTAQFSSIRLNEFLLLIIRSLLIIILVSFLAGFQLGVTNNPAEKWVVIDLGVVNDPSTKRLIDSLSSNGYDIHLLTKGFPTVNDSANADWNKNNWILAQQLAAKNLEDVIVISNNLAQDFNGLREGKVENIKWISAEPLAVTSNVKSLRISADSVWVRKAASNSMQTKLDSKIEVSRGDQGIPKIKVAMYADKEFDYDLKVLFAAIRAIDNAVPFEFSLDEKLDTSSLTESDWVIWLSNEPLKFKHPNVIAIAKCDRSNAPLLQRGIEAKHYCKNVSDNWWIITQRLTEDVALSENLSIQLASIVLNDYYDQSVSGQRTVNEASLWATANADAKPNIEQKSSTAMNGVLMLLFALTMIAERLVARNRNQ